MDNSINWIQADLKPEIAEVSAQAGFDSGAQQYGPIVVPGSGFEEALNWDKCVLAKLHSSICFYSCMYGLSNICI